MIVDTSALAAILLNEPEKRRFGTALFRAEDVAISAGNWLELTIVLARFGRHELIPAAERLRDLMAIEVASVTVSHSEVARAAYLRYGKGSGHPARLNFGDCFAYALAAERDLPLLFKGDDFGRTDVRVAAY